MDRKLAHNLMTANTPMGRAYRDHLMNGLSEDQILEILGLETPKVDQLSLLIDEQIEKCEKQMNLKLTPIEKDFYRIGFTDCIRLSI